MRLAPFDDRAAARLDRAASWWRLAGTRRILLVHFVPLVALANLAWEFAQLPLYTIASAPPSTIIYAVLHCTAGDVLIALGALAAALSVTRSGCFADWHLRRIAPLAIAFGLAYTIASERVNLALGNWSYAPAMPRVPYLEVGLAPLAQWLVVPAVALAWLAWRRHPLERYSADRETR